MPSTRVLLALATLAVVCTALAFIVFFALIRGQAHPRVGVHLRQPRGGVGGGGDRARRAAHAVESGGVGLILGGSVLATRRSGPSAEPTLAAPR